MCGSASSVLVAKKFIDLAESGTPELTQLKLMKMVYIAHGWCLGLYSEDLVNEDVYAWRHGPVFPRLYRATKRFGRNPVTKISIGTIGITDTARETAGMSRIDKRGIKVIEAVHDRYKDKTAIELRGMTHMKGSPWYQVCEQYGGFESNPLIPRQVIQKYYKDMLQDSNA